MRSSTFRGAGYLALVSGLALGAILLRDRPAISAPMRTTTTGPTVITALPYTVTLSGVYVLQSNLSGVSGASGITIAASDVSIDLGGFALVGVPGSIQGINVGSSAIYTNVSVRNGTVSNWGSDGVNIGGIDNGEARDLRVSNNGSNGIFVQKGKVTDCLVQDNGASGIAAQGASRVTGCVVKGNTFAGIIAAGADVSDCTVSQNGGPGIKAWQGAIVTGSSSSENGGDGILVDGSGINTRIDGNHVWGNTLYGIEIQGLDNVVVRNTSIANQAGNYYVATYTGSNNDVGPIGSAATSTSPWANISVVRQ